MLAGVTADGLGPRCIERAGVAGEPGVAAELDDASPAAATGGEAVMSVGVLRAFALAESKESSRESNWLAEMFVVKFASAARPAPGGGGCT